MDLKFCVILPAAGRAERFGGDKLRVLLAGRTVLRRSLDAFLEREDVETVILVAGRERPEDIEPHARLCFCEGGATRAHSVLNGLRHVPASAEWIAVHDAARPLVSQRLISDVFGAAIEWGAAVPGFRPADTIKRVDARGFVTETLDRRELVAVQTPQACRRDWLEAAYGRVAESLENVTDDVQLLERVGYQVRMVDGERSNLKITTRDDVAFAEHLLSRPAPAP